MLVKTRPQPLPWLVHAYTASGAVLAFIATLSAFEGHFREAFLLLIASTVVDATDGMFARMAGLPAATPNVSAALLLQTDRAWSHRFNPNAAKSRPA